MTRGSQSDPAVALARRCIAATLGVRVHVWDQPPRQNAHDLHLEVAGRSVAVEVKQMVDPAYRAAEAEVSRLGYTRDSNLTYVWDVRLKHTSRWKRASEKMPILLSQLEALRWPNEAELWRLRWIDRDLHERLEALGVQSVWWHPETAKHPPGFYLMPDSWGGGIPGIRSLPWLLSDILASPNMKKLRDQLANADVDERHAFIVFGWEKMEAQSLLDDDRELPSQAPDLPVPVNGVWATTTASGSRLIAWLPTRGWIEGTVPTAGPK